jgi:hypothetical protein
VAESNSAIHKHAFWLYGVLVGVAIKEALESGVAHIVNPGHLMEELHHMGVPINFPHTEVSGWPEVIRIIVFLVLIVRFYLGSAFYFGAVYQSENARVKFPITNYAADFFSGFLHFVLFVILALFLEIHTNPVYYFPFLVGFILMWDLLWFLSSTRRSTAKMIFWWMIANVITALISAVTYLVIELANHNHLQAERCAFYIVIFVSLLDIGLMMAKRPFFQPLGKWVPRDDILTQPEDTPPPAEPLPE